MSLPSTAYIQTLVDSTKGGYIIYPRTLASAVTIDSSTGDTLAGLLSNLVHQTGNETIQGNKTFTENVTFNNSLLPDATPGDIGSSSNYWNNLYSNNIESSTLTVKGTVASGETYVSGSSIGASNKMWQHIYGNQVHGGVWNDYAEFRNSDVTEPGRVIKENGDGTLSLTTGRLERGCEIITDTYGFSIGQTDSCQVPTAAAGRVLAFPDTDPRLFSVGAPVCSGPGGTVSMMTQEEEWMYPSRIIGTVSEIPTYDTWNDIKVNGRIWIRIK